MLRLPPPLHQLARAACVAAAACAVVLLAGCESVRTWVPPLLKPYRPDVQQGNIVTREMVEPLRAGMTREQVRFLLGTPMLTSIFHPDRWDYVYYLERGRTGEVTKRRLTVQFKNGRVETFQADEMPTENLVNREILGRGSSAPVGR